MKNVFFLLATLVSMSLSAQTENISGYVSVYKKVFGEAIANEKGIMVDRPTLDREYSQVIITVDKEERLSALALTRLDGRIELIATTGNNDGQLIGAYSSIRGDISLRLRTYGEGNDIQFSLDLVKNKTTIVTLFMRLYE